MSIINFSNTRQMEGLLDEISQVKDLIESKINLSRVADREKRVSLTLNKVMRICFIVGLSVTVERKEDDFKEVADIISTVVKNPEDAAVKADCAKRVHALCVKYPLYEDL